MTNKYVYATTDNVYDKVKLFPYETDELNTIVSVSETSMQQYYNDYAKYVSNSPKGAAVQSLETFVEQLMVSVPPTQQPIIEIDAPCELLPSDNPGKCYLAIKREITLYKTNTILEAFNSAGLTSSQYVIQFRSRKFSAIPRPETLNDDDMSVNQRLLKENAILARENAELRSKLNATT